MIKIVDKGKGMANLKVSEESIVASLNGYNESHYILASTNDVPVLVSALRKFAGKTGQDVADEIHIKQETISAYENGKRKMNLSVLDGLVSALGYKVSICIEKADDVQEVGTIDLMPEELTYNFTEHLKKKDCDG